MRLVARKRMLQLTKCEVPEGMSDKALKTFAGALIFTRSQVVSSQS